MMTSLTIDGYRSIKHLELTGLKKINLLVGANNSGKSSVLEAVGLASVPENMAEFMVRILKARRAKEIDLKLFFYMLDNQNDIELKSTNSTEPKKIDIAISTKLKADLDDDNRKWIENARAFDQESKLFVTFHLDDIHVLETLAFKDLYNFRKSKEFVNGIFRGMTPYDYYSIITFIPTTSGQSLYELVSQVIRSRKEKELLDTLRLIDDKIIDVSTANQDVYININAPERVPISILGDGITRITVIAASMIIQEKGVLLIDEIDTGFHYSALKHLWKTVLHTLNKQDDLQLFATTHSDECVRALYEVLSEEYPDNINDAPACLIRLERGEERHYATNYEPDVMIDTLESSNDSDTALVFHEQKYNK